MFVRILQICEIIGRHSVKPVYLVRFPQIISSYCPEYIDNSNCMYIFFQADMEEDVDITLLIYACTCIHHFDKIQYAGQKRRPLIKRNRMEVFFPAAGCLRCCGRFTEGDYHTISYCAK